MAWELSIHFIDYLEESLMDVSVGDREQREAELWNPCLCLFNIDETGNLIII